MSEVITVIISGVVSLFVSLLFFKYKDCQNKKLKKRILETNFIILIKDVQGLLLYLERIIKNREILEKYFIQELDYNQILIDYNSLMGNDKKVINNLLEFYNLRTKVKKYLFEEKIEIPDYLDKEMGVYKKNIWSKISHIRFIENTYKELENIFIEAGLENQLKIWEENFTFKSLQGIKEDRKRMLLDRKKELKYKIKVAKDEANINLEKKELDWKSKEFSDKLDAFNNQYSKQISAEKIALENPFTSNEAEYNNIILMYEEIYNIDLEIE